MRPVLVNVTLEEFYDTCVCQCYTGGFFMTSVFANVTLDGLFKSCFSQCHIGRFV